MVFVLLDSKSLIMLVLTGYVAWTQCLSCPCPRCPTDLLMELPILQPPHKLQGYSVTTRDHRSRMFSWVSAAMTRD